jgi:asparagine synthase (glutamine-hydrolysing)
LNYFDPPPNESERKYLRRAIAGTAQNGGEPIELIEIARCPENIRLNSLANVKRSACLPFYKGWLMCEPLDRSLASERGAALFGGTYGDQLFQSDISHADIDYVWRHPAAATTSRGVGNTPPTQEILWSAFSTALQYGTLTSGQPIRVLPSECPFVNPAVLDVINLHSEEYLRCYWRQQPSQGIPPGKVRHIGGMCMPSDRNFPFWQRSDPERVAPLLSQPLMELFLRMPSYVLNSGNLDRTIARRAFSDYLAPELLSQRMVEVGTRAYYNDDHLTVLRQNEEFMREMLLEGALVRENLLDREALERYLSDCRKGQPMGDIEVLETYFDLEIWLQSWKSLLQNSSPDL